MAERRLAANARASSPARPQRRPGGRSQRIWESVSNAALELLVTHGHEAVTMIEVARRAGVNPTSLYRRWGTREALLTEVLAARAESALTVPDTGTLRGDLTAYLKEAAVFLQTPNGAALLQLGVTALNRPDLQPFRRDYLLGRLPPVATILERAAARGVTSINFGGFGPSSAPPAFAPSSRGHCASSDDSGVFKTSAA